MEERKEIIEYLEENIRFFKNVSKETLNILKKDRLDINDYILLTPLLKQITNYALVVNILDDEMSDAYEFYKDLGEILGICNSCDYLVNILIDEECIHPAIRNYVNSINGISLRGDIFSMVYSLVDSFIYLDKKENKEDMEDESDLIYEKDNDIEINTLISLRNSISVIDVPTNELLDFMFKYILFSSKEKKLNDVGILNYLVSYVNMKIKIIMMINDNNFKVINYKDNDVVTNLLCEENFFPMFEYNFGDMILAFSDMFISLEKILEDDITYENINKITKLKEGYHLYQSYRFNYLKNLDEEKKILNKCKK